MGQGKKESTFGNGTSQAFTYDRQNNYLINFEYSWSSLQHDVLRYVCYLLQEIYIVLYLSN